MGIRAALVECVIGAVQGGAHAVARSLALSSFLSRCAAEVLLSLMCVCVCVCVCVVCVCVCSFVLVDSMMFLHAVLGLSASLGYHIPPLVQNSARGTHLVHACRAC